MIFTVTKEEFSRKVEELVKDKNLSYMESIISLFEEYSFDFNLAPKLLTQPLLEKLEHEARELNFLPKVKNKLPFS